MADSLEACPDKTNLKIEETTKDSSPSSSSQQDEETADFGAETSASEQSFVIAQNTKKDESNMKQSRVSFDKIEIREYPRCLGDNPSVSAGPPISLGWRHDRRYLLDLSEYEKYRVDSADGNTEEQQQQAPRPRRCPAEFQLPCDLRHQILREECAHDCKDSQAANTHCTETEINACLREVQKTKMQRRSSFALHETEHIQIFLESAFRKMRRLVTKCSGSKGSSSIEEDPLLSSGDISDCGNAPPARATASSRKRNSDNASTEPSNINATDPETVHKGIA